MAGKEKDEVVGNPNTWSREAMIRAQKSVLETDWELCIVGETVLRTCSTNGEKFK
jgi:hypothetical protein